MQTVFSITGLPQLDVPDERFKVHFIHAGNITVAFNELKEGAIVPLHSHEHETIDIVLEGELAMTIDAETVIMEGGEVCKISPNRLHGAMALTDCKVINIFYPRRDDFQAKQ